MYFLLIHCAFIMNFMADSFFILQIHHAKSFKMRHITYLYFSYLSIYILLIQIQVTILLSGTDVRNEIHLRPIHLYLIFEKSSRISKLIFAGSKNPVGNRLKIQFVKLDFPTWSFKNLVQMDRTSNGSLIENNPWAWCTLYITVNIYRHVSTDSIGKNFINLIQTLYFFFK